MGEFVFVRMIVDSMLVLTYLDEKILVGMVKQVMIEWNTTKEESICLAHKKVVIVAVI